MSLLTPFCFLQFQKVISLTHGAASIGVVGRDEEGELEDGSLVDTAVNAKQSVPDYVKTRDYGEITTEVLEYSTQF